MRHNKSPFITVLIFVIALYGNSFSQQPLTLVNSVKIPGHALDLWMYSDLNNEYILIGSDSGMHIIDVTNPIEAKLISSSQIPSVFGWGAFDIKTWQNYAYVVTGNALDTGFIFDISNPVSPMRVGKFPDSHNIFISDEGYLITEGPKMKIFDLNADPTNPSLIYSTLDDWGHDAAVIGDRLFDFHVIQTNIYSISNMHNPLLLGFIPNTVYSFSHSGWATDDGDFLMISCERCPGYLQLTMWDISDYNNIILTGSYNDTSTSIHNVQIRGGYAFVSYYERGVRVFQISDPSNIRLVAEYDPIPGGGTNFTGTFGIYALSPSGYIYASDSYEGLMIFEFDSSQVSIQPISTDIPSKYSLYQNYPNPFNPATSIRFDVPSSVRGERSKVRLSVYDITGKEVAVLVNSELQPGVYEYSFNGSGLGSGVYFYKLQSGRFVQTRKMILMK